MTKYKRISTFLIIGCISLLTSCAAILKVKSSNPVDPAPKFRSPLVGCIDKWTLSFESTSAPIPNNPEPEPRYVIYDLPELLNHFKLKWDESKITSDKCEIHFTGSVDIFDRDIDGSPGWAFLSALSIGIIPYWHVRAQKITISVVDKKGEKSRLAEHETYYKTYWSLFLWPLMPFFDSAGSFELFKAEVPKVIQTIKLSELKP